MHTIWRLTHSNNTFKVFHRGINRFLQLQFCCLDIYFLSAGEPKQVIGPGKSSRRSRDQQLWATRRWETDCTAFRLYWQEVTPQETSIKCTNPVRTLLWSADASQSIPIWCRNDVSPPGLSEYKQVNFNWRGSDGQENTEILKSKVHGRLQQGVGRQLYSINKHLYSRTGETQVAVAASIFISSSDQ